MPVLSFFFFRWMSLGCLRSRPSKTKPLVSYLNQHKLTIYYLTAHYPYCIVYILFLIMLNLCRQYVYSKRCDTLNLWKLPGNLGQSFYFLIFNLRSKMIIIFLFSFERLFRFHLIILCLSYLSKAKILFQNKDGDLPRGATRGRCRGTNFSQRVWKCRNPPHIRGNTCKSCFLQYTKLGFKGASRPSYI